MRTQEEQAWHEYRCQILNCEFSTLNSALNFGSCFSFDVAALTLRLTDEYVTSNSAPIFAMDNRPVFQIK
jgi:hypothetical protein